MSLVIRGIVPPAGGIITMKIFFYNDQNGILMTTPERLTRYEKARIIGARALQISMGAPSALRTDENLLQPIDIALKEFQNGIIPIKVKRKAHSGLRNPIHRHEDTPLRENE